MINEFFDQTIGFPVMTQPNCRIPWGQMRTYPVIAMGHWRAAESLSQVFRRHCLCEQAGYIQAKKEGNWDVAQRIVHAICHMKGFCEIERLVENYDEVTVVAPEKNRLRTGNMLPRAYATELAERFGLLMNNSISQIPSETGRTGLDGKGRLAHQAAFTGAVQAGMNYLIADDVYSTGGTMAALRSYIEARGGNAIGFTVLADASRFEPGQANPLTVDHLEIGETLKRLERQFGDALETFMTRSFGFGPESLTRREADFILGFPSFGAFTAAMRRTMAP